MIIQVIDCFANSCFFPGFVIVFVPDSTQLESNVKIKAKTKIRKLIRSSLTNLFSILKMEAHYLLIFIQIL